MGRLRGIAYTATKSSKPRRSQTMRRLSTLAVAVLVAVLLIRGWLPPPHRAAQGVFQAAANPPPPQPLPPAALEFSHARIDTAGDSPELCLRFTAPLRAQGATRYEDWVSISPPAQVAMHVKNHALCIGGLAYGSDYSLTLHKGLPAENGARLAADRIVPAALGDRQPHVDIGGDGYILPRAVAHGLTIETVNVAKLRIHVLRVGDRLLPLETRGSRSSQVTLTETGLAGYAIRNLLTDTATIVWTGTMAVPEDHNRTVQTAFPLQAVIKPGSIGAFLVVAEDDAHAAPEKAWTDLAGALEDLDSAAEPTTATHWVIATDIALTAYTGTDGLLVTARSLGSAKPLAHTRISLLSTAQDVLGEAATDADGTVRFAPGLLRGRNAAAAGELVAHGADGDWTLMQLSRPAFDFSDRGVTGRPSPAPLQAFLYTDRGIYRPGHTVELMALLRDRVGDAVDAPLTLVLRRPNGLEAKRFTLKPQAAAGFHQSIALSATAAHGTWSVEALADPQGEPVGRATFEVQDFVPQQLKVKIAKLPDAIAPGGKLDVSLDGDFLYGAPAAGLRGEADIRVTRDASPVPDARGWQFGLVDETFDDTTKTLDLPVSDSGGHTHVEVTPDLPAEVASPLKLVVTAGLFEPSGREVSDVAEVKLRARPVLIGLRARAAQGGYDQPVKLDIAAFDAAGAMLAKSGLRWQVIREEHLFDWFEENGGVHWHARTQDARIDSGTIDTAQGKSAILARKDDWGDYRLVVEDPQSGAKSSIRYSMGWVETAGDTDQPDKADVSVDKAGLAPGETARLHIAAPFAGHAQLLIANDRVLETREIDVPKGGVTVPVTAGRDWGAGAYALVSLYRPLGEGGPHLLVRAVGTVWIGMDAAPRTLSVAIAAPDRTQPQRDLVVPVHVGNVPAGDTAFVTLAAVDEGVLQLTRFASPDPVGFLFGKRALGVAMRDDYGRILDGSADPGQIQGGDEGLGGPGLPVESNRTVALFSGPVMLDPAGNARITLGIPDFEGQLRLMAVAYTAHGAGRAERTLIVRDPVIADIAMPRFLAVGDEAGLAVSLKNTDGAPGDYRLQVAVGGAAALNGAGDFTDALQNGGNARHSLLVDGAQVGVGTVDADLTGPAAFHVHRSWQLAVRSAHAPVTLQLQAWQKPGQAFAIDPALSKAFVPGSVKFSLGYSPVGGLDVPGLLQSLDTYPFGCTEQLSSTAFPLVYFGDPALHASLPHAGDVRTRVQDAIDTILDRQDEAGEFGLWRINDGDASTWLNVYALDFLLHAKEAGYAVPQSALERSAGWLRSAADGSFRNDLGGAYAEGPRMTRAYAAYVLARLGRIDLAGLRRLHDTITSSALSPNANFWYFGKDEISNPLMLGQMAGAFALTGDAWRARTTFRMAIDNLDYRDWPGWWFDWSYFTPLRDWAGLVAIAAESGQDDALHRLLNRNGLDRISLAQLNTQERAALLSAAHALSVSAGPIKLAVNGKETTYGPSPGFTPDVAAVTAGYSVTNGGGSSLWRALTVSGDPKAASPPLANGYTLSKQYYTLAGDAADPSRMRQNDRIIVVLEGKVTDRLATHRTVLVDLLPAGWEIESPVRNDKSYGFIGALSSTRVMEARDDRFVAAMDFGDALTSFFGMALEENDDDKKPHLDPWSFRVAYIARAITPGHFTLPEATVADMYRPAVMARTEAASTAIEKR
jgi:uncharacterized protein YfaS (alpha-2-macroglobulin family)